MKLKHISLHRLRKGSRTSFTERYNWLLSKTTELKTDMYIGATKIILNLTLSQTSPAFYVSAVQVF